MWKYPPPVKQGKPAQGEKRNQRVTLNLGGAGADRSYPRKNCSYANHDVTKELLLFIFLGEKHFTKCFFFAFMELLTNLEPSLENRPF